MVDGFVPCYCVYNADGANDSITLTINVLMKSINFVLLSILTEIKNSVWKRRDARRDAFLSCILRVNVTNR